MNFEDISLPHRATGEARLLCEDITTTHKKKVRLFYADGTKSSVKETDSGRLADVTRKCCELFKIESGPRWHFHKVTDIERLQTMLGL
jgi:hypothetical protein